MKIEIQQLTKMFGPQRAVDQVSFTFRTGEIFGFVGPNGAGKTTTMRIMATLEEPTTGDVLIDGISAVQYPEKVTRLIGYMPDSLPSYRDITVHEYLDFYARSFGIQGKKRLQVVEGIEEFTELSNIRQKTLFSLSKGMKQRVSLARALVHDPPVLLMDEPAAGLDPHARIRLRELLKVLGERDKAILISSHILTELEEMVSGVVIIEKGKIIKSGNLDELYTNDQPHRTLLIRVLGDMQAFARDVQQMMDVQTARWSTKGVAIDLIGDEARSALFLAELIQKGWQVIEFRQMREDLEQLYLKITEGSVQ